MGVEWQNGRIIVGSKLWFKLLGTIIFEVLFRCIFGIYIGYILGIYWVYIYLGYGNSSPRERNVPRSVQGIIGDEQPVEL